MPADRSVILIAREPYQAVINAVLAAITGLDVGPMGPNNIAQPAVAAADAENPAGLVVGRFGHQHMTEGDQGILQNMKVGQMPAITGAWGEGGLPTAQDGIDAFAVGFEIYVKPGDTVPPNTHLDSVLHGMGWARQYVEL